MCFSKRHRYGRVRYELFQNFFKQRSNEGGIHTHLTHGDLRNLISLTYSQRHILEFGGLVRSLLQAFKGRGSRIELATDARYQAGWFHVVDLHSLLAAGGE